MSWLNIWLQVLGISLTIYSWELKMNISGFALRHIIIVLKLHFIFLAALTDVHKKVVM